MALRVGQLCFVCAGLAARRRAHDGHTEQTEPDLGRPIGQGGPKNRLAAARGQPFAFIMDKGDTWAKIGRRLERAPLDRSRRRLEGT